jgi:exodeoxyribonuclease V alpha subunit
MILNPLQIQAVEVSSSAPVSVVTGGAGTGKTTILENLYETLEGMGERVEVCAPTGRAAKNFTERTGYPARTIHRLLEYKPDDWGDWGFRRGRRNPIDTEAVLVDEASMIDIELAAALLSAIRTGGRVVFVGDSNQLPPVGVGCFFADLIASGAVPVTRLEKPMRQREASWLSRNAAGILEGQRPVFDGADDCFFHETADVVGEVLRLAEKYDGDVKVLAPQHPGAYGTDALNQALQAALNPPVGAFVKGVEGERFYVGDRVMQVKNNYGLEVMNGDVGIVEDVDPFLVDYGAGEIEAVAYQNRLAYASTVHKAQGSEYDHVVFVCSSAHHKMLSRGILYTAVTRSRRAVHIVGDERGLQRALSNVDDRKRNSGLAERLCSTS